MTDINVSIIIVSTDDYMSVIERYRYLKRFHVIKEIVLVNDGLKWNKSGREDIFLLIDEPTNHYSLAACRNKGAKLASSDYLWFIDDDCFPSPTTLSQGLPDLHKHDVIFGLRPNINRFNVSKSKMFMKYIGELHVISTEECLQDGIIVENNMIIKKELFEQLSGFMTLFPLYGMVGQEFIFRLQKTKPKVVVDGNLLAYQICDLDRKFKIFGFKKNIHRFLSRMLYPYMTSREFQIKRTSQGVQTKYLSSYQYVRYALYSLQCWLLKR